jgi:hypothetical protein
MPVLAIYGVAKSAKAIRLGQMLLWGETAQGHVRGGR